MKRVKVKVIDGLMNLDPPSDYTVVSSTLASTSTYKLISTLVLLALASFY
jgi:hypothetical protein